MYTKFTKRICRLLLESEFSFAGGIDGNINDSTKAVVLWKNQSPVLYIVSIINSDAYTSGGFEKDIEPTIKKAFSNIDKFRCINLVALNIVVGNNQNIKTVNVNQIDEKVHNVFWIVGQDGSITASEGQPTKILNISNMVKDSADYANSNDEDSSISIFELKKSAAENERKRLKESNSNMTYAIIAANIIIFALCSAFGLSNKAIYLFANNLYAISQMQIYRFVTSMFLHADIIHILFNCISLYIFGTRTEQYMGKLNFAIIYLLSGIFGNVISLFFITTNSIGASGAIYGLIGAVLAYTVKTKHSVGGLDRFTMLIMVISGFVMAAVTPRVNIFAHFGGLIVGFALVYFSKITES